MGLTSPNRYKFVFLVCYTIAPKVAMADQNVYLHQTKPILLERENEFSLGLNIASSKYFDESTLGQSGGSNESKDSFASQGVFFSLKPLSNIEIGVELSNIFSSRNMYLLASVYQNPQIEISSSFSYVNYQFLGERIVESEQDQYDLAGNLIFKNLVQDLKPYLGIGIRQYRIVNNAVYYDTANASFVDESRFRSSYSLFFSSGVTYYWRSLFHAIRLEHSLSTAHFSGDDNLNSSFQIEFSWEGDLW